MSKKKRFKLRATVELTCEVIVEALDEEDALEQVEDIDANEWIEGMGQVVDERVEDIDVVGELPDEEPKKEKKS